MSKADKFGQTFPRVSAAESAAQMARKLNPMVDFESNAMKAASEMHRSMKPFSSANVGALTRVAELDRRFDLSGLSGLGKIHYAMGDHVRAALGGSVAASIAAVNPRAPLYDSFRVTSQLYDVHRQQFAQFGRIAGLDALREGVARALGKSGALAALDSYARVRDQLGLAFGAGLASKWDRVAAANAIPSLAALTFEFDAPTAVITLPTTDDALGTVTWLEPAPEDDTAPKVVVAAVHSLKPRESKPWRELKIATGSALTCLDCAAPFQLNVQLWLTSEDSEVFFQGEMLPVCPTCSGNEDVLLDLPDVLPYRMINGGAAGDEKPAGKLTLVVDNTDHGDE